MNAGRGHDWSSFINFTCAECIHRQWLHVAILKQSKTGYKQYFSDCHCHTILLHYIPALVEGNHQTSPPISTSSPHSLQHGGIVGHIRRQIRLAPNRTGFKKKGSFLLEEDHQETLPMFFGVELDLRWMMVNVCSVVVWKNCIIADIQFILIPCLNNKKKHQGHL